MLESFLASAGAAGVEARAVRGTWPEVAAEVETADVVVCHHAIYGASEIEDFVGSLTARARARVVVEVSADAPLSGLRPLSGRLLVPSSPCNGRDNSTQAGGHSGGGGVVRIDRPGGVGSDGQIE